MLRRRFIKSFSGLLSVFSIFPRKLSALLNPADGRFRLISDSFQIKAEIETKIIWSEYYISVEDFAQLMHFGIYTNEDKRKSVLYLERTKITFTADNTFVKVNAQLVQLPLPCH